MREDASSSSFSSFTHGWDYDVFLSFRGEDTRRSFARHLYRALREKGIRTFFDDQGIRKGEQITPSLLKGIQQSKTAIVVFSKNYASSRFCLEELVQILDCIKGNGRFIWPVFYHVDPSDVRRQKGSYKVALDKYGGVMNPKLVNRWTSALNDAANLAGWHVEPSTESFEYEIIEDIIRMVSQVINIGPLQVAQFPVGLESRVKEVCSLLGKQHHGDGARMIGIWGMDGIGKTTIARAVFNEVASQFKHICFLDNVRERSIHDLQKTLLSKTIREKDIGLESDKTGIAIIKDSLCNMKVLVVLDDIDSLEKLKALAGEPNWFASGSIIIITTRQKDLLVKHEVTIIYEAPELNNDEACELLLLKAFKNKGAGPEYGDIIKRVVAYARGLPLVLEALSSNLRDQIVQEWESVLDRFERIPERTVQEILKVSYDSLEEEEREIFLDIACFFNGSKLEYVKKILGSGRGVSPEFCITVLTDKSLVKIDQFGFLRIHGLIQHMGQEIVRRQSPLEPGKRSRLWSYKDVAHVLKECTGTGELQAIRLESPKITEVPLSGEPFREMKNLKMLIIWNVTFSECPKSLPSSLRVLDWVDYPFCTLPSNFNPSNLALLNLPCSLLGLENQPYQLAELRYLNLERNNNLMEIPDLSGAPNLKELNVSHCKNLTVIDSSVGHLAKLRTLEAQRCTKLNSFIEGGVKLLSLEILNLAGCSNLQRFPEVLEKIEYIKTLALSGTAIETLPESIEKLTGLECLYLHNCRRLRQIPLGSICKLTKLMRLDAGSCGMFKWFNDQEVQWTENLSFWYITRLHLDENNISDELLAMILKSFPRLQVLELCDNDFTVLPMCIKECSYLKRLYLDRCKQLREIRGIPPSIKVFSAVNCMLLTSLSSSSLLSQILQEPGNRKVILPGKQVPECIHCFNSGSSVSLWVRKKFPEIAVCVVFEVKGRGSSCFEFEIQVLINGTHNFVVKTDVLDIETGHIYLFDDVRHQSRKFELRRELLAEQFNHVRISCITYHKNVSSDAYGYVKCMGVYVYNHGSFADDILFENPSPPRRTLEDMISDADFNSSVYSDSSREDNLYYKDFQAIGASESSGDEGNSYDISKDNLQPEQHVTVVKEKILESSEHVGKAKEKGIFVYRDNGNKEKDSNTFEDPMEWEYQLTCRKDKAMCNLQSFKRGEGYRGIGTKHRRDWLYLSLCIIVSSVVVCRGVLLVLWQLRETLGCILPSAGNMTQ